MKIVVGLGNPGMEYAATRHNVGFMTIDGFAEKHSVSGWKNNFQALVGETKIDGEKVLLIKPQTFMNLSGQAVLAVMQFYKVEKENLLIIYDDMDLPVGTVKLRQKGSCGGHNGMRDIIRLLGTEQISRLKIGIGKSEYAQGKDFVLGKFSAAEDEQIDNGIAKAMDAITCWVKHGITEAMNQYNQQDK